MLKRSDVNVSKMSIFKEKKSKKWPFSKFLYTDRKMRSEKRGDLRFSKFLAEKMLRTFFHSKMQKWLWNHKKPIVFRVEIDSTWLISTFHTPMTTKMKKFAKKNLQNFAKFCKIFFQFFAFFEALRPYNVCIMLLLSIFISKTSRF